jgi:hypothetical protein
MIAQEIFVGAVSIVLGGVCIAAAIFNWPWTYEFQKARWIQRLCGRTGARIFFALLGVGLIVLGCAIALGFAPNASSRAAESRRVEEVEESQSRRVEESQGQSGLRKTARE